MPSQPPSSHDTSWQLPLATPRLELRAGTLTFPAPAHCIEDNAPGLKLVLVLGGQLDYQLQSGGAVNVEGPAFHISLSDTPFSVSHRYAARQALQYLSVRMPMQALHDTFGAELEALTRRIAPARASCAWNWPTACSRPATSAWPTRRALAPAYPALPVIAVTATREAGASMGKTGASLKETPQSLSIISQKRMQEQNLQTLDDVLQQATGTTVQPFQLLTTAYYARGFKIDSFEQDGVPVLMGNMASPQQDMAMLERVEILRGANGLLHGSGNPAATVNLVAKRPQKIFAAQGALSAGSWDRRRHAARARRRHA